jgi:hypothetical protein
VLYAGCNYDNQTKWTRLKQYVAYEGETRNASRILFRTPEKKRKLERYGHRQRVILKWSRMRILAASSWL